MSSYTINGVQLKFVSTGSDYRVEKGSSTIGYARSTGSGSYRIEYGSSTVGHLRSGRIEASSGSTLSTVASADGGSSTPDYVKATFLIYKKAGKI